MAASGQFDTEAISSHAHATAQCVTETEEALRRLVSSGGQLAQVWTTDGGQAFQQMHADFTRSAQEMTTMLGQIGQTVQKVAVRYDENESDIRTQFTASGTMHG